MPVLPVSPQSMGENNRRNNNFVEYIHTRRNVKIRSAYMLRRHDIYATCPWCGRGKTMADTRADIRISCHCSNCGKYYKVDFNTMRVDKINPRVRKKLRIGK